MELKRYSGNPILEPTSNAWENKNVFNCGATLFNDRVVLLYRAQGDDMISRLGLAFSDDGFTISERLSEPVFSPDEDSEYELLGVEDPRITKIADTYYITYTAASYYPNVNEHEHLQKHGRKPWRVRVSVAHTRDFRSFTRHGVAISHIDSKDAAFFPEKIDGQYVLLHRVFPDIRLAVADNLDDFEERGPIMSTRNHTWDAERVGIGGTPIKTEYGWLCTYHGTDTNRRKYSLGFLLFDLNDPTQIIGRSDLPILEPVEPYETNGHVNNVVFTCGNVILNDQLLVYYGGGDRVIGVASMPWSEALDWAKQHAKR